MKARMIVNPLAGAGFVQHDVQRAARVLREAGWQLDLVTTQAGGHATELSSQAVKDGCQLVIACGGDGTINEVLQSLVGTDVMLAVIPKGTVNVFAREFGIPKQPIAATRALLSGQVRTLDVGQANGRYFLLWSGIGFDAEIVKRFEAGRRIRLWILPFVAATVGAVLGFDGVNTRIEFDGHSMEKSVLVAIVSNVRKYALFELSSVAKPDDGKLDLYVFTGRGIIAKLCHFANFLLGRRSDRYGIYYRRIECATFQPTSPLPVQVDGEFAGTTPITCRVVPRSLKVLLPAGALADMNGS